MKDEYENESCHPESRWEKSVESICRNAKDSAFKAEYRNEDDGKQEKKAGKASEGDLCRNVMAKSVAQEKAAVMCKGEKL